MTEVTCLADRTDRSDSSRTYGARALTVLGANLRRGAKSLVRVGRVVTGPQVMLVHSMGKVGSTSVVRSLRARSASVVESTHCLSYSNLMKQSRDRVRPFEREIERFLLDGWLLWGLRKAGYLRRKDVKIITMVRDPVAVAVSGFFQTIRYHMPDLSLRWERGTVSLAEVRDVFLNEYPYHTWPLSWFQREIEDPFGVRIFGGDAFPFDEGYAVYRTDDVEVLVMRLRDLAECVEIALDEFLGIDRFVLRRRNRTGEKDVGDAYARFKEEVALPSSYVESMLASDYATHFFTEGERARSYRKWTGRGGT